MTIAEFRDPPLHLQVNPGEVHVVRVRLDGDAELALLGCLLDETERDRAARFVYQRDRRRFVVAHGLVRVILASCTKRPPHSLVFGSNPFGKPSLVDPPSRLRFSLSHAGELALVAVALDRELGVDIERERPIETLALSQRIFSSGEHELLRALPVDEQQAAFFRCWTRKESFIKALGRGLTFPLDGFQVDLGPDDCQQLLRACSAAPDQLARWRTISLPIDRGYAAALTVEGHDWQVVRWDAPKGAPWAQHFPKGTD